ncbi:MAG TPA: retropepsin-like aspartic protease [Thermoanaerobaculia bacterium]|nr:retropepsin-like aspartic protease [Thermoanaerobaculia bacterium]
MILFLLLTLAGEPDVVAKFERPRVVMHADVVEGMAFFRVRVAGKEKPLWFLVDTGSSYTLLDPRAVAALGLRPTASGTIGGAGSGRVPVDIIDGVTFTMPGLTTSPHRVRVADLRGVEENLNHPIDGFFGYDFLMHVVTTIDTRRGEVRFADPARFRYAGRGEILPIRFGGKSGRWIYIPATIKVPGVPAERSEFLVDSGSTDDANHPLISRSTGPLRETRTGVGLGTASTGVIGNIEWLHLGKLEVRDAVSSCCGAAEGTERQLGQGVLSRFVVTYDYVRKRVIVEMP